MARLLTTLTLAALEATLVSLPILALTSIGLPWPFLLIIVLLGAVTDYLSRRLPPRLERPTLAVGAVLALILVLTHQFGSLPATLAALIPGADQFVLAYTLSLITLFLSWRGTQLSTHDSLSVGNIFSRGAGAMVVSLLIGPLLGIGAPLASPAILAHIIGFISLSLIALALSQTAEASAGTAQHLGWRWLITLAIAIGSVVLVGGLMIALLSGGNAAQVAQNLLHLIVMPFALLGGLIAYLLITLVGTPLAALLRQVFARMQLLPEQSAASEQLAAGGSDQAMLTTITQLADNATLLMALIPLVILVGAILLLRRRYRQPAATDEERESLGVAANLAGDLRDLLSRMGNPFARRLEGLRAALASLRGDDPAIRVRRAYVRFLLLLEQRQQPRNPSQTPAELAAASTAPIATLTAAYERARYDPAGVTPHNADTAEQALAEIEIELNTNSSP